MNCLQVVVLACVAVSACWSALPPSRAYQLFPLACVDKLNAQIAAEFNAANVYLSLASYFANDRVALDGFAQMFHHSWSEEIEHADKLREYGIMRGTAVQTPAVAKPANDTRWDALNACQIINVALDLEKSVNSALVALHECGDSDPTFQDFLEANYLNEQAEANYELASLLTNIERATQFVTATGSRLSTCDGLGLIEIDEKLAEKFGKK